METATHGGEISQHGRHAGVRRHVDLVAGAEERYGMLREELKELVEFVGQPLLVGVGGKEFVFLGLGACLATDRPRHSNTDLEH